MLNPDFYNFILKWEGNYTTLDGGTNKGITFNTYKALSKELINKNPTIENFKALTVPEAKKFIDYFYRFSKAYKINNIIIAEWFTNFYWGSGAWAASTLIKTLNTLYNTNFIDRGKNSILTTEILDFINKIKDKRKLLERLIKGQKAYYNRIVKLNPDYQKFLQGWNNRINEFYDNYISYVTNNKENILQYVLIGGLIWLLVSD